LGVVLADGKNDLKILVRVVEFGVTNTSWGAKLQTANMEPFQRRTKNVKRNFTKASWIVLIVTTVVGTFALVSCTAVEQQTQKRYEPA